MDAKIDYVSWSVMHDPRERGDELQMWESCVQALWKAHPTFMQWAADVRGWSSGGARGHYQFSQFNAHEFAAVRFGGSANHVLIELPGTACQTMRDAGILNQVIQEAADRVTRLDMAVDIPGGCSPREFVQAGYNARFKSYAEIVSESGETEYVGSMKSERYARVYMYNPPHPRAGTLRVEHVLRSDFAKEAASLLFTEDTVSLAARLGNSFAWSSPAWQPEVITDGKLKAQRSDRHEPGRVRWLYNVVAPAIVKASREGLLDIDVFVARIIALSATNV